MKLKRPVVIGLGTVLFCAIGAYALRGMAPKGPAPNERPTVMVSRGTLDVTAVENGTVDAVKAVNVKSRVTGRLAELLVDEGNTVYQGQLLARLDPLETRLKVEQDAAQLRGAEAGEARSRLERQQRIELNQAALLQAEARASQLAMELRSQPVATRAAIVEAQTALETAQDERRRLVESFQPTTRQQTATSLAEAKANLANSQTEFERQQRLEEQGYVSLREVQNARLTLDLARTRLDSAQESSRRLDAQLRAELSKADASVRQAQAALSRARANANQDQIKREEYRSALAEVRRARANLRDAQILEKGEEANAATVSQLSSVLRDSRRQLGETEVRSPISGVVTMKGLQVGELATGLSSFGEGTTIVKVEDRSRMRVKLNMNEIDMAKLRVGMPADVTVDALPERTLKGRVDRIAPASIAANQTAGASSAATTDADAVVRYQVEVVLDEVPRELRSGMSAKCTMRVRTRPNALVIPSEYVLRKEGKTYALIPSKTPGAPAEEREIEIGASSGAMVEVRDGLAEGDKIERPPFDGPGRQGFMGGGGG